HGFGKSGAFVLYLTKGILLDISAKLNIFTSKSPPSQSPKTLAVILKRYHTKIDNGVKSENI
ncbi:MAG: hypothetical protein RIR11_4802, partial [Bacteroidota bacterium]